MRIAKVGRRSIRHPLVFNYIILGLLAAFSVGPLLTLLFNSVKTTPEISRNPLGPPLEGFRWQNYSDAWNKGKYAITMRNSLIITGGTVLGVLVVAGLASYSLARLKPRGSDLLTMYLLVGTSMPAQLFMVPLFFMWRKLGLVDNLLGIIIIYWATMSPFATFLLRSYMVSIPQDFEDAARVDGATEWQVFWHVVIPIVKPGFLTTGLVAGLGAWNEFLFAVTFLHKPEVKPVTTSLYAFANRYSMDWGLISAASVLVIFPVVALFLLMQRRFIEGLTRGGLKA